MKFGVAVLVGLLSIVALEAAWIQTPAYAQAPTRLYLSTSKATVIDLQNPASKVAVANPAIADVQVITPTQLLLIGRGIGVTSLIVFSQRSLLQYDVVVHGAPVSTIATESLTGAPYAVVVQRGERLTQQFFSRDTSQRWVEIGSGTVEAAPAGK
jgi:pilus assembly protein CpaC